MTHNFGVFAAFPQLLNGVGVLHVIHGDRVHHHHSVILTVEQIRMKKCFTAKYNAKAGDCEGVGEEVGEGLEMDW